MISPLDTEMASDEAVVYYGWEEFAKLYVVLTGAFPTVYFYTYAVYISVIIDEKLSVEIEPSGDSLFLGAYDTRSIGAAFSTYSESRGADLISDVLDFISEQVTRTRTPEQEGYSS